MSKTRKITCLIVAAGTGLISPTALGDPSSPVMVAFSQNGSSTPRYSIWNGSAWGSVLSMSSVGAEPYWVVLRDCPTRNEKACGTLDENNDVNIQFYNGSSWGAATQLTSDTATNIRRAMDLQYEQQSGDLLVAYWQDDGGGNDNKIGYRTYNGSTLSGESALTLPSTTNVSYVALYPKPDDNEILLMAVNSDHDLYAAFWNGSSWSSVTTLENDASTDEQQSFAAAYEGQSGDLLVAYMQNVQSNPRYRTWSGSSWSSEMQMPSIGADARWVRLAADSASDEILFASVDESDDINVNVWNGSSWGSNSEFSTDCRQYTSRMVDVGYEYDGNEGMVVWHQSGSNDPYYRVWNGSSWGSQQQTASVGNHDRFATLHTGTSTGEMFLVAADDGDDLNVMRWNGTSMSGNTQLESDLGGLEETQRFMLSVPSGPSIVPANIPYATDFESGVGAEWDISTMTTNGTLTTFLGRFDWDDSATLALNTTIGETYELVFDLYAIDSWDGDDTTYGPDYVNVDVDGTQVFHQTFSSRTGTYSPSFKNPATQQGHFGYDGSYEESVHRISVAFTATLSVTELTIQSEGLQDFNDESWGIDNVTVDLARFHDVSVAKSFDVQSTTGAIFGSGLHWGDLDGDGDLDAVITGNNTGGSSARVMINLGAGASFTANTLGSGNVRRQGALVDLDNDGDLDFWAAAVGAMENETYYDNNGSATLTAGGNLGFSQSTNNEAVAAGDLNHDGWCDLVMFGGVSGGNWIGHHQGATPVTLVGTNSLSYGLNDSGDSGDGEYCSSGDVNNDGYLDLLYHYNSGKLFLSNGDGTYTQNNYGVSFTTGTNDRSGSAWGDYDNDGDLDLFVSRLSTGNIGYLFRSDVDWTAGPASGSFTDRTTPAYVLDDSDQRGACWGDYDNDGDLDLYVVTDDGTANMLYRNEGDGTFRLADEGTRIMGKGHDAVFVDYDNDGDLDLAMTVQESTNVLLENRTNNTNYLKVRVVGCGGGKTNKAAVGIRVELWDAAGTTFIARRDIGTARGFAGTEPLWAHFGGVTNSTTYTVKVYFNSLPADEPLEVSVVPASASTTIGATTISQMLTVNETCQPTVIKWREVRN